MPIIRVPARIEFVGPGAPGFNVFHVRTVSEAGDELEQALDALEEFYNDLRSVYHVGTRIVLGEGMIRDPLGSPTYVEDDRRVIQGNGSGGIGPQLLAVVVSWRTQSASRSGRGRSFIGPLSSNMLDGTDGTPVPAAMTAIRSAADGLVNASTGLNDWAVGVLSTKQGILRDITGNTVNDRFSFLSSRRD